MIKDVKRTVGTIMLAIMMVMLCPCMFAKEVKAASYDANKALQYAKDHWNDGNGLCAEFVSNCVRAGGLGIGVERGTGGCANAVSNASGVPMVDLKLDSRGYATSALDGNILSAGDVVFQYCYTHSIGPHIMICGGYDSEGVATFYAHNGAMNNSRYNLSRNTAYQHTTSCNMGAKVIHISNIGQKPIGDVNQINATSDGKVHVRGWAFDPDSTSTNIQVHIYVGGPAGTKDADVVGIVAKTSRPDVDNVYHSGSNHGFDYNFATKKTGKQPVYIYAINVGGGNENPLIGQGTVDIPATAHYPKFEIEELYVTDKGKLRIKGWTYDPDDTSKSLDYHVYIGGDCSTFKTTECSSHKADAVRTDIAQKYNVGEKHGIDIELDVKSEGSQTVYLYAINIGAGNINPEMKKATLVFPKKSDVCDHEFTKYVSNNDMTCGKNGTKTAVCDKCHEKTDTIVDKNSATGNHTWDEGTVVKEATYDEKGIIEYRCKECGAIKRAEIPMLEKTTDDNANIKKNVETESEQPVSGSDLVWSEDVDELDSPDIIKVKNVKKKSLKVKIEAVDHADGYEYTFAKVTNSSLKAFKKEVRTSNGNSILFKSAKTFTSKSTTVKLQGLKKNKEYAVAVRAYKVVDGEKYYSDYSSVKCVKVRK